MAWAALMAVPPSISIAFCLSMPHCKHDLHMNQTNCEFCLPSLHYHNLMTQGAPSELDPEQIVEFRARALQMVLSLELLIAASA